MNNFSFHCLISQNVITTWSRMNLLNFKDFKTLAFDSAFAKYNHISYCRWNSTYWWLTAILIYSNIFTCFIWLYHEKSNFNLSVTHFIIFYNLWKKHQSIKIFTVYYASDINETALLNLDNNVDDNHLYSGDKVSFESLRLYN